MKEIKAYVDDARLEPVLHALRLAGAPEITFSRVELTGSDIRPEWVDVLGAKSIWHNSRPVKAVARQVADAIITRVKDQLEGQPGVTRP